jgi:hypothetical protein
MQPVSPLSLSQQQKQQLFHRILQETESGIRRDHENSLYKMKRWLANKFHAFCASSSQSKGAAVAKAAAKVVFLPLQIPVLAPLLSTLVGEGLRAMEKRELAMDMDAAATQEDKLRFTGEWAVVKGAEGFRDAVRKIDEAAAEFNKRGAVNNCDDYCERLHHFYFWKYRLNRLRYYLAHLKAYLNAAEKKLDEAEKKWAEQKPALEHDGPAIFDDWKWHAEHCKDKETCVFPWDLINFGDAHPHVSQANIQGRAVAHAAPPQLRHAPPPPAPDLRVPKSTVKRPPPPPKIRPF